MENDSDEGLEKLEADGVAAELEVLEGRRRQREEIDEIGARIAQEDQRNVEDRRRIKAEELRRKTLLALQEFTRRVSEFRVTEASSQVPGARPIIFMRNEHPARVIVLDFNSLEGQIRLHQRTTADGVEISSHSPKFLDPDHPETWQKLTEAFRWVVDPGGRKHPF